MALRTGVGQAVTVRCMPSATACATAAAVGGGAPSGDGIPRLGDALADGGDDEVPEVAVAQQAGDGRLVEHLVDAGQIPEVWSGHAVILGRARDGGQGAYAGDARSSREVGLHRDTEREAGGSGYNRTYVPRWRNGRRRGLKIRCPCGRVGSSPTLGTKTSRSYE